MENKFSLQELQVFFNAKRQITEDRFKYLFQDRLGYDPILVKEYYNDFMGFPWNLQNEDSLKNINLILPQVYSFIEEMNYHWEKTPKNLKHYNEKNLHKLIYQENENVKEIVLDLYSPEDIISYAEILKRCDVIFYLLPMVDKAYKGTGDILFFEGDIYHVIDKYWNNKKGNVYVAKKDGFHRLLYIKGKGYLNNGELNVEKEQKYSNYAVTGYEYEKIGNIFLDTKILQD